MNDCQCTSEAGYCDRHRVFKTARWKELCRRGGGYFRAWEEGRGPGQANAARDKPEPLTVDNEPAFPSLNEGATMGPGTRLHKMIVAWTGEEPKLGCGCQNLINDMNKGGVKWCRQNLGQIVEKIMVAARHRPQSWKTSRPSGALARLGRALWMVSMGMPGQELALQVFARRMVSQAIQESAESSLSESP
jgi:hypothetical protein